RFAQDGREGSAGLGVPNARTTSRVNCDNPAAIEIKSGKAQFTILFPARDFFGMGVLQIPDVHTAALFADEEAGGIGGEGKGNDRFFVRERANSFLLTLDSAVRRAPDFH